DAGKEEAIQARGKILHQGSADPPAGVPAELRKDTPRDPFWRVPRITADMLGIRPIDLAIIEGIETITAGEGPWNPGVQVLKPGPLSQVAQREGQTRSAGSSCARPTPWRPFSKTCSSNGTPAFFSASA